MRLISSASKPPVVLLMTSLPSSLTSRYSAILEVQCVCPLQSSRIARVPTSARADDPVALMKFTGSRPSRPQD